MKGILKLFAGALMVLFFSVNFVSAKEPAAMGDGVQVSATATPMKTKMKAKKMKKGNKAKKMKGSAKAEKAVYICPMCHIKSDKPGKCPECGMPMVKESKEMREKAGEEKEM